MHERFICVTIKKLKVRTFTKTVHTSSLILFTLASIKYDPAGICVSIRHSIGKLLGYLEAEYLQDQVFSSGDQSECRKMPRATYQTRDSLRPEEEF